MTKRKRPRGFTRTVQAEAFNPAQLAFIVETAIKELIDAEAYDAAIEREAEDRTRVLAAVSQLDL